MNKIMKFILLTVVLIVSSIGCSNRIESTPRVKDNISENMENKNITPSVTSSPTIGPSTTISPTIGPSTTSAPISSLAETSLAVTESDTTKKNIRFIVLADSRGSDKGVNSKIVKKILSKVKELSPQPEFAIMPGDLTEGSKTYAETKAQLVYFKQIVTKYYPVKFFYPGIGNHEMRVGEDGEKAFSETFSEFNANLLKGYHRTSYYIDVGDARLFMLNSDHTGEKHKIAGNQLKWLKSNIDQKKRYHLFFLHEPPYPTGAEAGNSLDKFPASRDAFWDVVDASSNPIVFCGHEHNYSKRLVDSSFNQKIGGKSFKYEKEVLQIVSGGFGAPLYKQYSEKKNMIIPPIPQYHFTVVDMNDQGLSVQVINIDGEVIDSFQLK